MTKYHILGQAKDKRTNTRYFRVVEISSGKEATLSEEQIKDSVRKNEFDNANVDKLNNIRVYNRPIRLERNEKISITEQLDKLMPGSPLRIRINSLRWIQCIYVEKSNNTYTFFDNSSITGMFGLSERWIKDKNNAIQIDLANNNPEEVAKLLRYFNSL